jgi:hypothetical protein
MSRRIGTKGFCVLATSAAVFLVFGWGSGELTIPWPIPLMSVLLVGSALKAKREVDAFNHWQRRWNAMAGIAEPVAPPGRRRRQAFVIWLLLLFIIVVQPFDSSVNGFSAFAFTVMTLVGGGRLAWNCVRGTRGRSAPTPSPNLHIVHTPLPVPRRSPAAREATASLPDYCRTLLARTRDVARQK